MALSSTLHRFEIDLTDVDRGVYDALDLRVAQHPSESVPCLLTRVVAWGLHHAEGMVPSAICEDEPALAVRSPDGRWLEWIEVGQPSAERLHRAAKAAPRVCVYTYRRPEVLVSHLAGERIHRREEIELYAVGPEVLEPLSRTLGRQNRWSMVRQDDVVLVSAGDVTVELALVRIPLA